MTPVTLHTLLPRGWGSFWSFYNSWVSVVLQLWPLLQFFLFWRSDVFIFGRALLLTQLFFAHIIAPTHFCFCSCPASDVFIVFALTYFFGVLIDLFVCLRGFVLVGTCASCDFLGCASCGFWSHTLIFFRHYMTRALARFFCLLFCLYRSASCRSSVCSCGPLFQFFFFFSFCFFQLYHWISSFIMVVFNNTEFACEDLYQCRL